MRFFLLNKKPKVFVKFPKSGLGNLMLIWAKANLFAELNQLTLFVSPWWGFRWGSWWRYERKKRLYRGYFKENTIFDLILIKVYALHAIIIKQPSIGKIQNISSKTNQLFVFNKISSSDDLFADLRDSRDYIKEELYKILNPLLLAKLNNYDAPVIAVHIRRGDFVIGNQVTPLSFFIDCIVNIRESANFILPVTIFTDALENEICEIMKLPAIRIAENKQDILDILLMSQSKVIVLSQSSTFSYWGAFLSDAIILKPHKDWQQIIRSNKENERFAEIRWKENDPACKKLLSKEIDKIKEF